MKPCFIKILPLLIELVGSKSVEMVVSIEFVVVVVVDVESKFVDDSGISRPFLSNGSVTSLLPNISRKIFAI
ncbi:hypothetical protein DERP_005979 [Dermatophagoides pteronyssinus]|uniref:Uncharacterized protein n=1 Tax=Dermatophagoides pteronyssinus TaxID=6956 RepID=A0ABQ8JSK5_DERPT|nr:hypothetical protein DERP_005979 [Dermatophagoides pteronyssinus]